MLNSTIAEGTDGPESISLTAKFEKMSGVSVSELAVLAEDPLTIRETPDGLYLSLSGGGGNLSTAGSAAPTGNVSSPFDSNRTALKVGPPIFPFST